ncbi:MAG: peptidoglycan bridge formation glycyltransferase FemA/FemB family protein [Patescibacteria group bacterium]|nr:peptidoglycan bridge formation glycyltransferase FemA/FemB family protein [Patescibacteria group bacterium]
MELLINQEIDQPIWDHFITKQPGGSILQSWAWGEFHRALGNKVWRFSVTENGETINQLLVIKLPLRFNYNIFYAPRGLVLGGTLPAQKQHLSTKLIVDHLKKIAKDEDVIFFRTDPPVSPNNTSVLSTYRSLGFLKAPKSTQPKAIWQLDISPQSKNLLMQMKQKTRYNIRLAEKRGVDIKLNSATENIDIWLKLIKETSTRDKFLPHSDEYYKKQAEILSDSGLLDLFIAYKNNRPLAASLVSFYGDTATYLHGASSNLDRASQAPYLMHWEIIKAAKEHGTNIYDFGGITTKENHPWTGITRFKTGFGGKKEEYVGNLELPLHPQLFKLYQLLTRQHHA